MIIAPIEDVFFLVVFDHETHNHTNEHVTTAWNTYESAKNHMQFCEKHGCTNVKMFVKFMQEEEVDIWIM